MDPVAAPQGAAEGGSPAAPRPTSTERRERDVRLEAWVGVGLVLAAALGGILFPFHPSATVVDDWYSDVVGPTRNGALAGVTSLRYPQVIVIGSLGMAALALPRDRLSSLACLLGPPLALATCELVAKPLVGRHLGAGWSYPSGSSVGASALATAAVLAVAPRWRRVTLVLGVAYVTWMGVAVTSLQWHYPTDVLGGTAYGAGVVLMVDSAVWWAGTVARTRWGRHPSSSRRR
jgi:undecaprenyl-diphosphatase